ESQALSAIAMEGVADAAGTVRLFRGSLARAGVQVAGGTKIARAGGWPLAVHWSPPLAGILRHMDVVSDNFTAELVLKQLGAVVAGEGTTAAGAGEVRSVLFGVLPVSGRDGTLEDRMSRPPARGNVRAKTGTLNGVSALSGYVRERFAFAVLVNTPGLSTYAAHAAQDRFATVLAQQR